MNCRFCDTKLEHVFADLGFAPPSNSFLKKEDLKRGESYYPLKVYTCNNCKLVQLDEFKKATAIFSEEYVYFSSMSKSWLAHSKKYTDHMISTFGFNQESLVIEIASNDGYLLQYFHEQAIPVLGIEPTESTAKVSREKGINTVSAFFGEELATNLVHNNQQADLVVGNNVLAHVPDINDFVKGLKTVLKQQGIVTMEFPHLLELVKHNQFDTIYHEHFSYLSLTTVKRIFEEHGLSLFNVEQLPTHGGSLRVYAKHQEDSSKEIHENVSTLLKLEDEAGMNKMDFYTGFQQQVNKVKNDFLKFLLECETEGKTVAAYGAAAKGNTLLNYAGVKTDIIQFVVDAAPIKQNKYLPGSHIPVVDESHIRENKPDYIIIFPWNIKHEIMTQLEYVREWNAKFVIFIPQLELI